MAHPFKRTFYLQQHTPLIHFQHDQAGATLRATEVKAKLDRYLLKHEFNSDFGAAEAFLINPDNGESAGLDYKMQISIYERGDKNSRYYEIPKKAKKGREYPMFFGNMGDDYQTGDRTAIHDKQLRITIHSFNTDLLPKIDKHMSNFLASNNFGMRSSKGYGSFSIKDKKTTVKSRFSFSVKTGDWRTAFKYIDLFYKSVRGGINGAPLPQGGFVPCGRVYMKPLIFIYADKQGIMWEKRLIKQQASNLFPLHEKVDGGWQVLDEGLKMQEDDLTTRVGETDPENWPAWQEKPQKKIVRDVLGLSTDQTWRGYGQRDNRGEYNATVEKSPTKEFEEIERFPSPFLFKPIKTTDNRYRVDVFVRPMPSNYLGAKFKISVDNVDLDQPYAIWEDFNMNSFINDYLNLSTFISAFRYNKNHEGAQEIYSILKDIYTQINSK